MFKKLILQVPLHSFKRSVFCRLEGLLLKLGEWRKVQGWSIQIWLRCLVCVSSWYTIYFTSGTLYSEPFFNFQVITTDALVASDVWRKMVRVAVDRSFNQITVSTKYLWYWCRACFYRLGALLTVCFIAKSTSPMPHMVIWMASFYFIFLKVGGDMFMPSLDKEVRSSCKTSSLFPIGYGFESRWV